MLYDQIRQRFKIVFGDSYTDIDININPADLLNHWVKFRVEIDFKKGVSLYCNDKFIKSSKLSFKGNCLKICFGACNYADFKSTDVTPMKIRDLSLNINNTGTGYTLAASASLAMLREADAWKHVPVVIFSGYGDVVNRDIMTRLGASAVLTKPLVDLEILPATIRRILS